MRNMSQSVVLFLAAMVCASAVGTMRTLRRD